MDTFALDWLNLLLRWLHVITGIAWIGSSFYFVWLDNSLERVKDAAAQDAGVGGELWSVHGGGFYHARKFPVGPRRMPDSPLHWFYWESYWTWMSGFALLVTLYFFNADAYLVDRQRMDWGPAAAVAAAMIYLVAGWIVYDRVCRTLGRTRDGGVGADGRVGVAVLLYVAVATWVACRLFPGRAAFLLTGAMLATIMSANVLIWIIPGQRKVVADIAAGRQPDPVHGQRGKQRSLHNTYLTLPVLVAMVSNHYSLLYAARWNWLVLVLVMLAGAAIRLFFVQRHKGRRNLAALAGAAALLAAAAAITAPVGADGAGSGDAPVGIADVRAIAERRCVACHGAALASKGIRLDDDASLVANARVVYQQVVVQRLMPLNNATAMTDAERNMLARWFRSGAPASP